MNNNAISIFFNRKIYDLVIFRNYLLDQLPGIARL